MTEGSAPPTGIRTPDQRLRVFVSSTLAELADERAAVARAITALRLTPVMFELGARPHPPRELYRAYLAQSDIFVGLYWQRYGWIGPGMDISGLEDELELSGSLPRLLYVKGPAPDREGRLDAMLERIKGEGADSYRPFRTARELGRLVRDDLALLLSERFVAQHPAAADPDATAAIAAPRPDGDQLATTGPIQAPRASTLPVGVTRLIGREHAVDEVADLVCRPDARLVTLTGPGGIGKTRLAMAVGERLKDRFGSGTVYVRLAAVTDRDAALAAIARAVGADLAWTGAPVDALAEHLADGRWLLLLDNLEQITELAADLDVLLSRCPGLEILATSRTALLLRAEHEFPVPPLPVPADPASTDLDELRSSPAVVLFLDRAAAVRPDFALTEDNAAAIAELCRRLDGLPLAIELAAARTRLLDPEALLRRLVVSLDALGSGAADLPERQRTLRATVDWSVELLDDDERSLLESMAVFVDGWTIDAAAHVTGLGEDRALDLTEALARHSLVHLDVSGGGPRSRMLETVREFVAERLAARPDAAEIERRHASHYRALAEQADRPLRGVGQREWAARLEADSGNLGAAVRWHLAHDTEPLPHLFRVLWVFWWLRDHLGEARLWVDELVPVADELAPLPRAELLWTAAAAAAEVGDDAAGLAARDRLGAAADEIDEPFVRALVDLVMAWISPLVDDLDGALRHATAALEQLRRQDEPFWTALATGTLGFVEAIFGHDDDARRHLTEMGDLTSRFDDVWLAGGARVQLGALAAVQGRLDEARALLVEGLDLGSEASSTRSVTLFLVAFSRLMLQAGDPEQAALVAGAAEGLRRRAGLRVWPTMRQGQTEFVARIRETLGPDRFAAAFAAGGRLNRREAVAAARDWRAADASVG